MSLLQHVPHKQRITINPQHLDVRNGKQQREGRGEFSFLTAWGWSCPSVGWTWPGSRPPSLLPDGSRLKRRVWRVHEVSLWENRSVAGLACSRCCECEDTLLLFTRSAVKKITLTKYCMNHKVGRDRYGLLGLMLIWQELERAIANTKGRWLAT